MQPDYQLGDKILVRAHWQQKEEVRCTITAFWSANGPFLEVLTDEAEPTSHCVRRDEIISLAD